MCHINVHISKENTDIYTALALKCNKNNLMYLMLKYIMLK
jgi:hypothetical protein